MRDFETIETALLAAETGHLVFSTLHTLDATETINRIVAVFPPHQQKQIRLQLASVLKAVVSQRLIPKADGKGRAPAVEVLITTPFIRDCIIDKEKTHLIHGAIAQGTSQYGMQTFDQSIFSLFEQGLIVLRRSAALGVERGRVQAEGPGHLHHLRRRPRPDGPRRRRGSRPGDTAQRRRSRRFGRLARTSPACSCSAAASCPRRSSASAWPAAAINPTTSTRPSRGSASERALDDGRVRRGDRPHRDTGPRTRPAPRAAADRSRRHRGTLAQEAMDEVFAEIDADALLTAALERRLRGRDADR